MSKILIVRLSSLGDIIHSYPMLYDIKTHEPDCTIDWLIDEDFADLVRLNPQVDQVIAIPLRRWKKNKLAFLANFSLWAKEPNISRYDYIIDAQGLLKSAILARYFAMQSYRVGHTCHGADTKGKRTNKHKSKVYGYAWNSIREKLAIFFYNHCVKTGKNLLAINKNRRLAATIFNYTLDYTKVNFGLENMLFSNDEVNQSLTVSRPNQSKYVVILFATSKAAKKLPVALWAELIDYLMTTHGLSVILPYGNEQEQLEAQQIKTLVTADSTCTPILIPKQVLSYIEINTLLRQAAFVFGVDTGLTHLANALAKPLIAIYIATNPQYTGVFSSAIAQNLGGIGATITLAQIIAIFNEIQSRLIK